MIHLVSPICKTTSELHSLIMDKRYHFTVIRVTQIVLNNLTSRDYADMLNAGIILWRVN